MTNRESSRIVILTEGHTNPITAKTAASVIRYRPRDVVAVLDTTRAGEDAGDLLGVGNGIPVIASLDQVPDADTLMIGIAPPGGRIPAAWRAIVRDAIQAKMNIVSGLHDFLSHDAELVELARCAGVDLIDVRKNDERDCSTRQGLRDDCLRILTVGNDCCVGKMVVSIEVSRSLQQLGHDAVFVATGQTGILIAGDGCPVDCVVSDFVNGAAEKLVLKNQQHDILLIEGQGSLSHPRYSAVTLGLLHGTAPQGMILCYEAGRTTVNGMPHVPLAELTHLRDVYEMMAGLMEPAKVIGIAMNSRLLSPEQAEVEAERIRREFGLPCCDVFRHGANPLASAVLDLKSEVIP